MKISKTDGGYNFTSEQATGSLINGVMKVDSQELDWSGEYEISGVMITAMQLNQQLIYLWQAEKINLLWLGNATNLPTDEQMETIGNTDVLLVDAGNSEISVKNWHKLIEQIEPRLVLLIGENAQTTDLIKELGTQPVKQEKAELELKKSNLAADRTEYWQW